MQGPSYKECPENANPQRKESKQVLECQEQEQMDTKKLIDGNIAQLHMVTLSSSVSLAEND